MPNLVYNAGLTVPLAHGPTAPKALGLQSLNLALLTLDERLYN